ncbi:MAG: hypothetical protein NC313_07635 [Butyrivibrio sp.]|nr:hypothetical protein [Butyrivibrio sp.]
MSRKMRDKELEKYLRQSLRQEVGLENGYYETDYHENDYNEKSHNENDMKQHSTIVLEETVKLCTEIMREQKLAQKSQKEPRTSFIQYLSDVFRFEGIPIFALQAVTLFIVCLIISAIEDIPEYIPSFMPLFVLALMPVVFRCRYYGMSEMEAATRASGAQIILAKLILGGAANLVCMTVIIFLEMHLQNSCKEIGRLILYCLVPYLVCLAIMLRLIRQRKKENIQICAALTLGSCVCWGMFAKVMPWLYEASAFGIWIMAFLFFAAFFIREIYFIITMRKEGKMYGIIA